MVLIILNLYEDGRVSFPPFIKTENDPQIPLKIKKEELIYIDNQKNLHAAKSNLTFHAIMCYISRYYFCN